MKESIASIYHKTLYSISAQILNFLVSLVSVLFIPKMLAVEQYGYWQLYLFYVGYIGFFYFGLGDGIYLRYGGKFYDELDKPLLGSQIHLLVLIEIVICLGLLFASFFLKNDYNKQVIVVCFGINCIIVLPRAVLLLLLQCTGRIKEYAGNIIIERLIFCILAVGFLTLRKSRFEFLIVADICAKIIASVGVMILCHDIVFSERIKIRIAFSEFYKNIAVGIKLLFANIAGMLILGVVQFGIERNWDIVTFGKVSFSLSISGFILAFINAISLVIFPVIKRSDQDNLPEIFKIFGNILTVVLIVFLITYYPIQKLLLLWLPRYTEAIRYFAILFPISLFEARAALLNNTYLKALREENAMFMLNGITVCISFVVTGLVIYVFNSLTLMMLSIVGLQIVKCLLPEFYLQKRMKMNPSYNVLWNVAATCVFIYGNWFVGGVLGWMMYIAFVVFMVSINLKQYRELIYESKKMLKIG